MEEEDKSKMAGDTSSYDLVRCGSSTREMLKIHLDSLPDDLVIDILTRIPAQDIFDATMLVCRKWYHMVINRKFIFAHLHHSTPGLLIMSRKINEPTYISTFMSMRRSGQIEITKSRYNFKHQFWSSCNGLILEPNFNDPYELIVTNPVTKLHFPLPPFILPNLNQPKDSSVIAHVATQMDYKVVRTYCLAIPTSPRTYCAILTFGVDNSWRVVDTQHLSHRDTKLLDTGPLVTEGFVHWLKDSRHSFILNFNRIYTDIISNNYVLTLNVETESITRTSAPQCNGGYYYYKYYTGGSYLSLLIGRSYLKWDVWEMKPETGEWTQLPDIDLEAHKSLLNESYDKEEDECRKPGKGVRLDCKLIPAGWLKYRDVVVFIAYRPIKGGRFSQSRLRVVYNVITQDMTLLFLDYNYHTYLAHQNSLIGIR